MEATSFTLPSERHWTEEKERALIAFYSKHSCLWNHKSEIYRDRQLRWNTLEHLRILLSGHPPQVPFTVEDIKNKFKNLRTTFQRQYKLVIASKTCVSEEAFVSQWKHFHQLMFLSDCWETEEEPLKLENQVLLPPLVLSFQPSVSSSAAASSSTSSSSSGAVARCYWTEEKERALISFYSEHSCLWNKKSENHNNRQLRQRTLETLRGQLSEQQPVPFTVEDIKNKFKNLRTVFQREYKAVSASKSSGADKVYVPQWKHYQQLMFLRESCDEDELSDDLQFSGSQEGRLDQGNHVHGLVFHFSPLNTTQTDTKPSAAALVASSPPLESLKPPSIFPSFPCSQTDTKHVAVTQCQIHPSSTSPASLRHHSSPSISTHADTVLCADARCYWTEEKVHEMISFYSENSCLWNHKSDSYRNRQLRLATLETLRGRLSEQHPVPFTVEDVKTKFRNLRTIFHREHKAVSSNKTCGSEDFYVPKWKHYQQLMFLCDSCEEDEHSDELHFPGSPEEKNFELGNQVPHPVFVFSPSATALMDQTDTKLCAAVQCQAPPSPTPTASIGSSLSSPSSSSSYSQTEVKGQSHKRQKLSTVPAAEALDFMKSFYQKPVESPHAGFLKYVEECLNETPPDKVKRLKKKIIETIHSVSEEL